MGARGTPAPRGRGRYNVEHKEKISITVTEDQLIALKRSANQRSSNVSALIRELINQHLEQS